MGLLYSWSRFRDSFHEEKESDQRAAHRLGNTPPEMWSRKDWMLSRRLRHLRQVAIKEAIKKGKNPEVVDVKYPESIFWPWTPFNIEQRKQEYIDRRTFETIARRIGEDFQVYEDWTGVYAVNPYTGEQHKLR